MAHALKNLVLRIRRAWPTCAFEYGVVVEAFKNGYPHFHVAARAPYIPHPWLSETWGDLVGAPVVHIGAIRSQAGVAGYLAKYLAKGPVQFGAGKRYWFSQGYRLEGPVEDRLPEPTRRGWWSIDPVDVEVRRLCRDGLIPIWRDHDHAIVLPLLVPPEHPP